MNEAIDELPSLNGLYGSAAGMLPDAPMSDLAIYVAIYTSR